MSSRSYDNEENHPHQECCCGGSQRLREVIASIEVLRTKVDCIEKTVREEAVAIKSSFKELEHVLTRTLQDSTPPVALRSLSHQGESSASKRFHLRIDDACLPETLYTMTKLKHQGGPLTVELLDDFGSRVENGPASSAKVKCVVLNGGFEPWGKNWTQEDFNKNIVSPRAGKGDLLKGKCEISLDRGAAIVSDISFTDNTRKDGTVRLCVQVLESPAGVHIRGAVSKPFTVKERRGQSDMKHEKPSPCDDLWRLKHIRRDGKVFGRAEKEKICTVQDFLQLYHTDPNKLRSILDVPDTNWREIVENAEACVLSSELYRYSDDTRGVELLLDCAFNIISVTIRGQLHISLDAYQQLIVDEVRRAAYQNRKELEAYIPTSTSNQMQLQSPTDQMQLHTNAYQLQMHTNAGQMLMHSPTQQMQVYNNDNLIQMHAPASQTHISAVQMQMHTHASQMQMRIPPAASQTQMRMHNPDNQIQMHIPAHQQMHAPAEQMQMQTPASQMQMPAELSWSATVPSWNVQHLNVNEPHQGMAIQHANGNNAGRPLGHFEYDGEAAFGVSDCSLSFDIGDFFRDVPDCFQATTSSAPCVVHGAANLAARVYRDKWLPIRAVLKFKFARKVSDKQQSPRGLKRKMCSSD